MSIVILKLFKVWKPLSLKITKPHASSLPCPSKRNVSTAVDPLHLPTLSTGAVSLLPLLYRPPFRVLPPGIPSVPQCTPHSVNTGAHKPVASLVERRDA